MAKKELQGQVLSYVKTKSVRNDLKAIKRPKKREEYQRQHERDFIIAESASRYFKAYGIENRGTWSVVDSVEIEGRPFYLMQNDKHGRRMERIVIDSYGKIIIDDNKDDLGPYIINCLKKYIRSERVSVREKLKSLQGGNACTM